jgi:hypothetical protein
MDVSWQIRDISLNYPEFPGIPVPPGDITVKGMKHPVHENRITCRNRVCGRYCHDIVKGGEKKKSPEAEKTREKLGLLKHRKREWNL